MKKRSLLTIFGAILLLAGSLSASNIQVNWTGSVLEGTDDSNTFGLGMGANLAGQTFQAKVVVDPTIGFIQSYPDFFSNIGGASVPGYLTSPIVSASLTINGQSFNFQSEYWGGYTRDATPNRSQIYTELQSYGGTAIDEQLFVTVFLADNSIPFTGINESLDIALPSGTSGHFQAFTPNGPGPFGRLFAGNLSPNHVTIGPDVPGGPDVPEPSSAVLLVSGLGAIAMRFRRRFTQQSR